jgi:hypothetical protein
VGEERADACSTRALSAAFICSNPTSVFASVPLKSPMREAAETLRHDEATAAAVKRLDSYLELRALLEFTANQAD